MPVINAVNGELYSVTKVYAADIEGRWAVVGENTDGTQYVLSAEADAEIDQDVAEAIAHSISNSLEMITALFGATEFELRPSADGIEVKIPDMPGL